MSKFLEEVFAAQAAEDPPRRVNDGLSGSSKRFAALLALMVGLTAIPTLIMIRAGVDELESSAASPIHPIVLGVPEKPASPNKKPLVFTPGPHGWPLPVLPSESVAPQGGRILERKATVDASPRPGQKHQAPAPQPPSNSEPPQRRLKKRKRLVEFPPVERPIVVPPDPPLIFPVDVDLPVDLGRVVGDLPY